MHWTITDVEFVTNGICAKYFWALVELSRINAKNYPLCEICRIQVRDSQKNGVSFYLSKFHLAVVFVFVFVFVLVQN